MSDDQPRRSRTAWPGPLSVAGVGAGHTHELPSALRQRYRLLLLAVVALLLAVGTLTYFVYQQQQYIQGRGEQRDRENERLQEQIRRSTCDLLDQLPEGGLLDRPRQKYGCGPVYPLSDLPPELQERYAPPPEPAELQAPTGAAPDDPMSGAVPDPYRVPVNDPPEENP